ncbi:MAG: helix-turn-helix domain-containing protein [Verrucomicrobiaceae bacterium]
MPFCFFTIRATKTSLRFRNLTRKGFNLNPESLGQHLRSKRLLLNLTQAQTAEKLGTIREQYERWERDEITPVASFWPKLVCHFGRYPLTVTSPADWVLKARRVNGLSQYALGRKIKVIAKIVREWEHGKTEPPAPMLEKIRAIALQPADSSGGSHSGNLFHAKKSSSLRQSGRPSAVSV